jgi:hypothetical protein
MQSTEQHHFHCPLVKTKRNVMVAVEFTEHRKRNDMNTPVEVSSSSSNPRCYSSNRRNQMFATKRDAVCKPQFLTVKTTQVIRLCLLFSLAATVVHIMAVNHRYALLSDDKSSLMEKAVNTFYDAVVLDGRPVGSTTKVSPNAKHQIIRPFMPAPLECAKLAYFDGGASHKLYEPVIRAFHSRGWSITKDLERAHVYWFDQPDDLMSYHQSILPWQRINQLPNTYLWDDKDSMAEYINRYYKESKVEPLHSFPESYVLNNPSDLKRFQERLLQGGGLDIPWVIKQPTVNYGMVRQQQYCIDLGSFMLFGLTFHSLRESQLWDLIRKNCTLF